MAATMSAALVSGSCVALSNVGDCRAYLLRNQELTQVTRDHSWVAEQVRSGVLDEAAARVHPLRNLVTRAINGANRLDVDVVELGFLDGNLLLLCSDGLHGPVSDDNIKSTLLASGTPTEQSKKLVELANANGGPDNITALIIRATP
jgi:protein phosphatase